MKLVKISQTLFFVLCSLYYTSIYSQVAPEKYWIMLTDKNNSPYSLSNPSAFLSQKSIDRRIKYGISFQQNDLPVNPFYIDSIRKTGVTIINWSKWFNFVTIETNDSLALNKIYSLPFVKNVRKVAYATTIHKKKKEKNTNSVDVIFTDNNDKISKFNIPVLKKKSVGNYNYGFAENQVCMIACDYLHDLGFRGEGMTIAVLDAGFWNADTMAVFDSLWLNGQILGTRDFVKPGNNVFNESSHGMMVLSIMGGNIPGKLIGTAPKANYWLLRSEDANSEYLIEEGNWAVAAEFADSVGADIINSSLGYTIFDDSLQNHTYNDLDGNTALVSIAADIAASKGILIVNSAGNSANEPWHYIGTPADADSILTVGAVDPYGDYAYFSSVGPTSDGRIKPDVCAQGVGTWVASMSGGNNVSAGNGTSFSSPVIAGASACLWQSNLASNNMEIIQAIKQSSSQYNNPDALLGYGIPNFAAAFLILSNKKIYNIDEDENVNIFPNPFIDKLYIVFSSVDTHAIQFKIFNLAGKLVHQTEYFQLVSGFNSLNISNLNNLSKGIYILNIISENKNFSKKIIKIK